MNANARVETADLLSQLTSGDARSAQIAQLLMALNGESESASPTDSRMELKSTLGRFKKILRELRRENERLREINNGLLAHSELLAGAVGACPECWGEDSDCKCCEGDGGPGAFLPEHDSFDEFVRPVLHMLRESMIRKRRQRDQPNSPPQEKKELEQ